MEMGDGPHLQCLARHSKIEVKEKASVIEAITALMGREVEMANRYQIFAEGGKEIFYGAETTNCCTRQLQRLCPDCAPWNTEVLHHGEDGNYNKAFHMERPCTWTCCCFNRPIVHMFDSMNSDRYIGSIQDPCALCDLTFTVRGRDEEDVLKAKGGCCQWGLCCPLPCGPCSVVEFKVEDMQGKEVGNLRKKVPGCLKFLFASDVDNYEIDIGAVENPEWKALLLGLSLFIDFRYFNDNRNDNSEDK